MFSSAKREKNLQNWFDHARYTITSRRTHWECSAIKSYGISTFFYLPQESGLTQQTSVLKKKVDLQPVSVGYRDWLQASIRKIRRELCTLSWRDSGNPLDETKRKQNEIFLYPLEKFLFGFSWNPKKSNYKEPCEACRRLGLFSARRTRNTLETRAMPRADYLLLPSAGDPLSAR